MANIIVAFSKPEDAKSIKNILMKNGFEVVAVCTSGAQVLSQMEDLNGGIVVCGYRLTDMLCSGCTDSDHLKPVFHQYVFYAFCVFRLRKCHNNICQNAHLRVLISGNF